MKHLTIIALAFFLAACVSPPTGSSGISNPSSTTYDPTIIVKHDDQRNVTCWVYVGYQQGSMFCMTDKEIYGNQ